MDRFFKVIGRIVTFTPEEIETISQLVVYKKLKQQEFFVSEGKRCNHLAFILSGFMRTFHVGEDGKEITSEFSLQNKFIGSYHSFYSRQVSFEYIQAMTDCEVLLISYEALHQLYETSFNMNVMGRKILEDSCIQREVRLKKLISLPALARYEWFVKEFGDVYKVAQLQHIASFLGIKPETLSRVRRKIIS